jgi:pilus assembly protein CpaC
VILATAEGNKTLDITVSARDPNALKAELDGILQNYPDVQLRVVLSQVVIEGSVKTEAELMQIREIAKRYAGLVSVLVAVGPSGVRRNVMVRLDVHYVQVRRRLLRKFGLSYPPTINGGNIANFFLNSPGAPLMPVTQYSLITDLLPNLDLNEANGFVKVMRTDTLVTENGSKATYKDGTEIRVRLTSALGTGGLQEVFFGSSLSITPRLTASNDAVSLDILADLSQRDSAAQQDGIPGRLIDIIQTTVHVPIGQSVMLAGVNSREIGRSTSGIPWLSRIPILGYLFGSETKDAESVYGVVYITPTLVEQTQPQMQQYIEKALKYYESPGSLPR